MTDIAVIDWSSGFALAQLPVFAIAIWMAWTLTRGYVVNVHADAQRARDGLRVRSWSDVAAGSWMALVHAIAAWSLACALFALASGFVGVSSEPSTWLLGGAILLPLLALAERLISPRC